MYQQHKAALSYLDSTDKSLVVTATMGFGWQQVLSEFMNKFEGSKMLIASRMMIEGAYRRVLTEDSVVMKTPQKLSLEDTSQYTPDLLVVEWPKTNTRYTKWDKIIDQVADQSKRVIRKVELYNPNINYKDFEIFKLSEEYNFMYGIKELK